LKAFLIKSLITYKTDSNEIFFKKIHIIKLQKFIHTYEKWKGAVDFDFNKTHALYLANLQSKLVLNLKMESLGRCRENIIIQADISGRIKPVLDLLILVRAECVHCRQKRRWPIF
jgi:hypothetical protein